MQGYEARKQILWKRVSSMTQLLMDSDLLATSSQIWPRTEMASCKPPQRLCDCSPMPQAQWPLEQAVAFPKQACKGVFPLSEVSHTPVPVISCPVLCNSLTLTTNTIWMRPGTDHSGQWPELRVVWWVIMQEPWPLILCTDRWAILKGLTQLLGHQKQRGG